MTKTMHLDKDFKPIHGEEITFESFIFNGGEPHIKITGSIAHSEVVWITTRLNSFNDLGLLCVAVDALRRMGVTSINAYVPYFPGARQDRVMIKGEPLTVKVYAQLINQLAFNNIIIFDPHSEVTPALLNNCTEINNLAFISEVIKTIPEDVLLISPDAGALKKIYKLSAALGGITVIECLKKRNVSDGSLSSFKVLSDDLQQKPCLIVDDICDGGGTFLGLAKELKAKNAGKLYLAVSHGIFQKGTVSLKEYFEGIYTTDSIKDHKNKDINLINLFYEIDQSYNL